MTLTDRYGKNFTLFTNGSTCNSCVTALQSQKWQLIGTPQRIMWPSTACAQILLVVFSLFSVVLIALSLCN